MTQGTLLSRFPVCLLKSFFSRKHPVLTLENSKGKSPSCRMGKVQGSRRNPAQRFRWESEEKVCLAHEKSPKAFFIALGLFLSWSGQRGSNSLPPPWQGGALPDELNPHHVGASGRNRTNDTRIFSPLLYLLSYRGMLSRASALLDA